MPLTPAAYQASKSPFSHCTCQPQRDFSLLSLRTVKIHRYNLPIALPRVILQRMVWDFRLLKIFVANTMAATSGMTVEISLSLLFCYVIANKTTQNLQNRNLSYSQTNSNSGGFFFLISYAKKLSATLISATYPTLPVM